MYSLAEYELFKRKYGSFSSWSIWDIVNESDTKIINTNYHELNSNFVVLGLNISKPITESSWSNFRGGKHDRKLKYALNYSKCRGCYITDIFKGIPAKSTAKLQSLLTPRTIERNVVLFRDEMKDIKISKESIFLLMGTQSSILNKCFHKYFRKYFNNIIINHYHYSYYKIKDEQWVEGLWQKLKIEGNVKGEIRRYIRK